MRIGLLGPSDGDVASLGRASEFLLNGVKVHRALYLGIDGALDRAVSAWARKLVGDNPSDDAAWLRAAEIALSGVPDQIDRFVVQERARQRLKALAALPDGQGRTVEMLGDRVAVLIHDKAALDEEDILGAGILVYGKSEGPFVKRIGPRWFVSPGPIGCVGGGIAVIDDEGDDIRLQMYDSKGNPTVQEVLSVARATKMIVQGES